MRIAFVLLLALLTVSPALAQSPPVPESLAPPVWIIPGLGQFGSTVTAPRFLAGDGTALLPAYSFASEPTLGFWRSAAATVTLQGALTTTAALSSGSSIAAAGVGFLGLSGRSLFRAPAIGHFTLNDYNETIGSRIKVDALPTIASGFGTTPFIVAGSTPLAGAVNVGSGGTASSGTVTYNGTAFPQAPFCVATNQGASVSVRVVPSTTNMVLTNASAAAWPANEVVSWICISAK